MPNTTVYTNNQYYQDIADAIRSKNGASSSYKPSEMAPAINALVISGQTFSLQSKTIDPTVQTQTVFADTGYNALSQVTVNAIQTETKTVTENGTVRPTSGKFLTLVNVAVTASDVTLENIEVTPTESVQTFSASTGYQGLGTVTVSAIPSNYVGSSINTRSSADLTMSGATVTAPAGYYATSATKTISSATQVTPTISVNSSGLITATATQSAGYVAAGTKTATEQLLTQTGTTATPNNMTQTLASSGAYLTGDIKVAAVPVDSNNSFNSNGTKTPASGKYFSSVTINVPVGSTINNQDKTITPTESVQTISASSGYTGLGTVTINAIPDDYVGSSIATRSGADLILDKNTVNVPHGYYADSTSATVTATTRATPTVTVSETTGIVTAQVVQGTGYVTGGTSTTTLQLSTQSGIIVTPTEELQVVVVGGKYVIDDVSVAAISSTYVGSGVATKSSADLTANGATVTAPAGYYASAATKTITSATQATPAITVSTDGKITATTTQTAGYVAAGTKTATEQLSVQSTTTITPKATSQTAVAAGKYTTGVITVAAVPTDTNNTFNNNGTYTPVSGKWFDSITVSVPSGINNEEAKTITPSTATQTVTPGTGYSGLSKVTVNPIPSNYITTSDATATASHILNGDTAYVNGSKVTGTMTNNGATGGTINSQGGTYTIPAGYTSGGTVTASLTVSTITNGVLNVETVTEATNDYGVRASITIPAGYYNATTLSKVLSTVLPAPSSAITQSQMLSGYEAYNNEGQLLVGTMTNRNDWGATLDQTTTSVTIPEGYHNGSGVVSHTTVNIPDPTISLVNSTGVITASGTWTRGFTTDNSYTKTYTLTTQTGTTITPSETAQTAVASYRWTTGTITVAAISTTYVGSGVTRVTSLNTSANTVTAPAGYYASALTYTVPAMTVPTSTSASSTGTRKITVTPSTVSQYINLPTGYNSATAYFQINAMTNGAATGPSSVSGTAANLTTGNGTLTLSKTISITPVITTTGYISAGTATNATVTLTANVTTKAAATITPGTTNQTIAAGTYLTGTQTILGDADLTANNIASGANIFGINGTFTDDATATASDIVDGETAYVEGRKITGNLIIQRYYTGSGIPSSGLGENGDLYLQS